MVSIDQYEVSFPGLGIHLGYFSPYVFNTFIKWYGVIIAFGFLLAAFYALKRAKEFELNEDNLLDGLLIGTPVAIVSARLFYVLFSLADYSSNPISVLFIWEGGLAVYGGIIGAFIASYFFCRKQKIKFGNFLDLISLGFLIGQAIGRWGNFFNREVFGRETSSLFRMVLTNPTDPSIAFSVHPLFLYESFWNALGFVLLHFRSKKRTFPGEIFLLYIAWYGLGRGIMEGLRDPAYILKIAELPVDRILAFLSCTVAVTLLILGYKKQKALKLADTNNSTGGSDRVKFELLKAAETPEGEKMFKDLLNKILRKKSNSEKMEIGTFVDKRLNSEYTGYKPADMGNMNSVGGSAVNSVKMPAEADETGEIIDSQTAPSNIEAMGNLPGNSSKNDTTMMASAENTRDMPQETDEISETIDKQVTSEQKIDTDGDANA
ncbi:MAG: prolipoprotein diacylglyceryl transferase [Clostridiales bacterium]|nr:prolipoprotein diacylglyceryl transferase [Clostridiales bacterium]